MDYYDFVFKVKQLLMKTLQGVTFLNRTLVKKPADCDDKKEVKSIVIC